ncbi:MAG: Flp family type IVb pilin [Chloroflexi bacterium]|nr:Flp family type IVb pilin [Chloroflexota bacterium]
MEYITRFWKEEEAIETMEFALIAGLVAIAAIAGATTLGTNLQTWFAGIATTVGTLPTS